MIQHPSPPGYITREYSSPCESTVEALLLLNLLDKYGPHYAKHFAVDMRARLSPDVTMAEFSKPSLASFPGDDSDFRGIFGAASYLAPSENNDCDDDKETISDTGVPRTFAVSNCNIIHDHRLSLRPNKACLDVGLFGSVITDIEHRRKGLSKHLVPRVIHEWDKRGGGFLILGTGSRHAAAMYERNGFVHLAGGLDAGEKGYNPDDEGETIMVRPPSNEFFLVKLKASRLVFDTDAFVADFYGGADFAVEPLSRAHFAEMILLFNIESNNDTKLTAAGITDGVYVEEKMVALINASEERALCGEEHMRPLVVYDVSNRRVHGIAVANIGQKIDYWSHVWDTKDVELPAFLGTQLTTSKLINSQTYEYVVPSCGSATALNILKDANSMKTRTRLAESLAAAAAAKLENEAFMKDLSKRSEIPLSPHISKESIDEYERDLSSHLEDVLSSIKESVDPVIEKKDKIMVGGGYWI